MHGFAVAAQANRSLIEQELVETGARDALERRGKTHVVNEFRRESRDMRVREIAAKPIAAQRERLAAHAQLGRIANLSQRAKEIRRVAFAGEVDDGDGGLLAARRNA